MLLTADRRSGADRRDPFRLNLLKGPPRRREDRRSSPRIARRLLVRAANSNADFALTTGDVSLGGVRFSAEELPRERDVEVRFYLPNYAKLVVAGAKVTRVELDETRMELLAAFCELDVRAELAIARFLDERARLAAELAAHRS